MKAHIFTVANLGADVPSKLLCAHDFQGGHPLPRVGEMVNVGGLSEAEDWGTIVAVRHDLRDMSVDLLVAWEDE